MIVSATTVYLNLEHILGDYGGCMTPIMYPQICTRQFTGCLVNHDSNSCCQEMCVLWHTIFHLVKWFLLGMITLVLGFYLRQAKKNFAENYSER